MYRDIAPSSMGMPSMGGIVGNNGSNQPNNGYLSAITNPQGFSNNNLRNGMNSQDGMNQMGFMGLSGSGMNSFSGGLIGDVGSTGPNIGSFNRGVALGGVGPQTSGLPQQQNTNRGVPSTSGFPSSNGGLSSVVGQMTNTNTVNQSKFSTSVSPTQQLIHRSTTPNGSSGTLSSGDSYRPSESILSMINGQQQLQQLYNPSIQNQKPPQISVNNIFKNISMSTFSPQQKQAAIHQMRTLAQQNGYDANTIDQHMQEYILFEQRMYQYHLQQQQQTQQQQQRPITADDKFGLLGLSNIFKTRDADLNALALGLELTSLGLNLNSPDFLYQHFASPFSELPPSNIIPEYKIPDCYKVNVQLQEFHVEKFMEDTLLYIFYTMPRDVLQIVAARELTKRGWKYHKPTQLWFQRDPLASDFVQSPKAEKGTYFYFDTTTWSKKRKVGCVLEYDLLYNPAFYTK